MKYKTILVDLDDTLVVEEKSADQSFMVSANYVRQFHDVDAEAFVASVKIAAKELWYSLPTHQYARDIGIASREALWADFSDFNENQRELQKYKEYYQKKVWIDALSKCNISDENLASILSSIFIKDRKSRHVVFDDALNFLNTLGDRHYHLALITNGTPDLQWQKIKKAGIERYFQHIIISGEIGHRKPGKTIFLHCLNILNADMAETIMVGDSIESDIKGANGIGVCSVWLNRDNKENTTNIKPDYEIKNLKEFIDNILLI